MRRLIIILLALCIATPVLAQTRRLTGNPVRDISTAVQQRATGGDDAGSRDILGALEEKLLPDLKYALAIAKAQNNTLTGNCWSAWIEMIEVRQKANVDAQNNPLPEPSPALITKFQRLNDIRNALQPDSKFMVACAPVANLVKSDIRKFIGVILTGGAGLTMMGIGL